MKRIAPADWTPIGVESLETTAEQAVRAVTHTSVVAGPGAGKTELLAQRACYLLQTGICASPKRILAISFKKDARRNLSDRVKQRCGRELARRFDSMTFDAFAKGLVDRFLNAIPEERRPTDGYEVATHFAKPEIQQFLSNLAPPTHIGTKADIAGIEPTRFLRDYVHPFRLLQTQYPTAIGAWAAHQWWMRWLQTTPQSFLSFPMIGRLAELLLRTNPQIASALQTTYGFVFLDEFQDTTRVQFDLLETAFSGADAVNSAVGDNKQRIMGWAEALDDAFATFEHVFPAQRINLCMNFRSSPELVAVQRGMIAELDSRAERPTASRVATGLTDACSVWLFPDSATEAGHVADKIVELCNSGVAPRDICVLVKQRVDVYADPLIKALAFRNIAGRNEAKVQDLLVEPVVELIILFLRCAAGDNSAWPAAVQAFAELSPSANERKQRPERVLAQFIRKLKSETDGNKWGHETITVVVKSVVEFLDPDAIRSEFPQYRQGNYLTETLKNLRDLLVSNAASGASLGELLDVTLGMNSIPIMTIHKSKGLEYDTVIFLGLEDDAFWSFTTQADEDRCAFFVAFSRAKNRALFTFSESRVSRAGYRPKKQSRAAISSLYQMLQRAGAVESDFRHPPVTG